MKIKLNGFETHYELEGQASGPVITMSHSLATDLSIWDPQMDVLLRSYLVLRYDTRGHGQSDTPPGPYSLEMLAGDVRALLQALGIEQTHFIGVSMGGMIGQQLALESPEMLRSLVLCDTTSRFPEEIKSIVDERIRIAVTEGMEPHVATTIERWFTPSFREAHPEIIAKIGAMIRSTDSKGYIACSHAIRNINLTDQIHRIKLPTLILVGENDPATPVSAASTIHENIRGSDMVVLKPASHLSNIEQDQAFNQAVVDFLSRVERPKTH